MLPYKIINLQIKYEKHSEEFKGAAGGVPSVGDVENKNCDNFLKICSLLISAFMIN